MRNILILAICLLAGAVMGQTTVRDSVQAGGDDCYIIHGASTLYNEFLFGDNGGDERDAAFRVTLDVPDGATIDSAFFQSEANATRSETVCSLKIYCEDTANSAAYSDGTDFAARHRTTAYVNWNNVGAWTIDNWYTSPDIKGPIQEVVNRADYDSANYVTIFIESNASDYDARRNSYAREDGAAYAPKLIVYYTTAGGASYTKKLGAVKLGKVNL